MKKWTVDFGLHLDATIEGIEAHTAKEAKEIAIDMLLDDPSQYLDFDNEDDVDVWLEDSTALQAKE
ncbi:MAG: hypothetical protein LBH65_06525 [Desulfovibrio sp.]|jgi:hypothetical protein|nr:hypothetical protein [Desulfovibrio sp.]